MIRQTQSGVWVIDNDTHHTVWIEQTGKLAHDESTLPLLKKYIPRNGVVVDGGAHVGTHTVFYLECVTSGGSVISFEPNLPAYKCLQRNCPEALTYQLALGNNYGCFHMTHDQNYGGAFISENQLGALPVFMVPLDALHLQRLDFLKLDIEGSEIHALIGAEHTISRCKPVMLIEVNECALKRQQVAPVNLYNMINNLGYRHEFLFPGHNAEMPQTDVLCFPK